MPERSWDEDADRDREGSCPGSVIDGGAIGARLDHMKLLWPSAAFMKQCHSQRIAHSSESIRRRTAVSLSSEPEVPLRTLGENEQVFFLPQNLVQMGCDNEMQMHLYVEADSVTFGGEENDKRRPKVPHNKTYLRLIGDTAEEEVLTQKDTEDDVSSACRCQEVAWLLLTSMCLSKGVDRKCFHLNEVMFLL